jgi:DNA-binding XRE family transcriptional regulator
MAKSFKILRDKMPRTSRAKAARLARNMVRELPLHELRAARRLSQEALAEALDTAQSSVSRLERRTDMYVSTLRSYVEAMGGTLEITARFPDGTVKILTFDKTAR